MMLESRFGLIEYRARWQMNETGVNDDGNYDYDLMASLKVFVRDFDLVKQEATLNTRQSSSNYRNRSSLALLRDNLDLYDGIILPSTKREKKKKSQIGHSETSTYARVELYELDFAAAINALMFARVPTVSARLTNALAKLGSGDVETYHVDELGELKLDADAQHVRGVDHGAHELVVVGQQVVVEALRVGVAGDGSVDDQGREEPHAQRFPDYGGRHGSPISPL
jgi:hypothetical protein